VTREYFIADLRTTDVRGGYLPAPWHFLYFFPEPQGQGSFRPTSGTGDIPRFTAP